MYTCKCTYIHMYMVVTKLKGLGSNNVVGIFKLDLEGLGSHLASKWEVSMSQELCHWTQMLPADFTKVFWKDRRKFLPYLSSSAQMH